MKEELKKGDMEYQFQYIANDKFKLESWDEIHAPGKENEETGGACVM